MTLEAQNISAQVGGRTVVSGISLSVEPRRITAIIGANGAGKSELVLALAGVLPITEGDVTLDGASIKGLGPEYTRRVGVAAVPEGHRVLTQLTVEENLRVAGMLIGKRGSQQLPKVYDIFPELAERKTQLGGTLSGGQQQMLALGQALMAQPQYLLLDEMSLGLAPVVVKRLLDVVKKLRDEGTGILLIEQFTDLALGLAEDAIVMRGGKMTFSGPAETLVMDKAVLHKAYFGV